MPPTRARFGLCQPEASVDDGLLIVIVDGVPFKLDILFRMLEPQELAAATESPRHHIFHGTKAEMNKQIGNAVPVDMATELNAAMLGD